MKRDCRVVLVLGLAVLVMILAPRSESATGPKKSKPTFAYYQDNPYQYLYGNVVNARMFRRGDQQFTNVEVKPVQTYPMFSQYVTFCGNQEDKLDLTTSEPVVLVYSRIMHRLTASTCCGLMSCRKHVRQGQAVTRLQIRKTR